MNENLLYEYSSASAIYDTQYLLVTVLSTTVIIYSDQRLKYLRKPILCNFFKAGYQHMTSTSNSEL